MLFPRSAGILLPVSSLPGPLGIGDLGPAALRFADFLHRTHQRYWQILPVNPITEAQGYSPYSSFSAMAGNPLFISPELLIQDGLLKAEEISADAAPEPQTADYQQAIHARSALLNKAYNAWNSRPAMPDQPDFERFCREQSHWLDDYALYEALKKEHGSRPWYAWPPAYRARDANALDNFDKAHGGEIRRTKWIQMMFDRQWKRLRSHCHDLDIRFIGDLPFYVAHDSADVWANPGNFTVSEQGNLTGVAGVPPDLFNDNGQLWGMPLFNWDALRGDRYRWWTDRLQRNMELFDLVRLDHFRAFSAYWSVDASASTAKEGIWIHGPGKDFFATVRETLGSLPFIAEDLGEIDRYVFELRDCFDLPGMNVLQFAFGEDMPQSLYLPHHHSPNSVVYTGTHDNNTTLGWFSGLPAKYRKNISAYAGMRIHPKNVSDQLCRIAYASVAGLVILPLQDILGLDSSARMNTPASGKQNWLWRLTEEQLTARIEKKLRKWVHYYGRRG